MRTIELDASKWSSVLDFYDGILAVIGAPEWHGTSVAALIDTMIWSDEINAIRPPYLIKVINAHRIPKEISDELHAVEDGMRRAGEEFMRTRRRDAGVRFEIA